MRTMQKTSKNGKILKNAYTVLQRTGKGVRFAADTGYRTGYFMAKHPNFEMTKNQIQRNYKAILITTAGLSIGLFGALMMLIKSKVK